MASSEPSSITTMAVGHRDVEQPLHAVADCQLLVEGGYDENPEVVVDELRRSPAGHAGALLRADEQDRSPK